MIDNTSTKIQKSEDIDKIAVKEGSKLNSLQICLQSDKIDKKSYTELFNKLNETKGLQKLEVDLTKYPLDSEQVDLFNKALKKMDDLKEVYIHISDTKFDDDQFEKLIYDSLTGKKSIEKIHLVMENVNNL